MGSPGMILSTGGTGTFTGGTIAFGSAPGAFFGTNTVSSAITGTSGLLNALGTLTLNGDLSGLSGTITQNGFGTTTLATNTFAGAIEVREGTFNINTSQTLAGQGAITLGVSTNDVDMVGAPPFLTISGAGTVVTVTYTFSAPGGTFDFFDDGLYAVAMVTNQVGDTDTPVGHFVSAGPLPTASRYS